jgi:nitric oxide reductase subunit B
MPRDAAPRRGFEQATADLFPAGVLQLWDVISNGYWHARRLDDSMTGTFHKLEWIRVAGDTVFIVLGALPITVGALRSFLSREVAVRAR